MLNLLGQGEAEYRKITPMKFVLNISIDNGEEDSGNPAQHHLLQIRLNNRGDLPPVARRDGTRDRLSENPIIPG